MACGTLFTLSSVGPSTSQPPRLPRLSQPVDSKPPSDPARFIDISPYQNKTLHHYDQDVVRELSIPPQSVRHPINSYTQPPRHSNGFPTPTTQPDGSQPSSYLTSPISNNVSLNTSSSLRTPPVPVTQPNFLAQHGLPVSLPPPPRTTFYSSSSSIPSPEKSSEANNIAYIFDSLLTGSYSQMLSQKDTVTIESTAAPPRAAELEWSLDDMLKGDLIETNIEEFLTSPLVQDESPEETPFLETPGEDVWTSPMIDESDDSFGMERLPLFGAVVKQSHDDIKPATELLNALDLYPAPDTISPTVESSKMDSVTPSMNPLDSLSTMHPFSPAPAIHPASLQAPHHQPSKLSLTPSSSLSSPSAAASNPSRPTKAMPTGTRRNITPAELVSLDAPTQPRQYVTPSVTSRKVVPSAFAKGKKRAHFEVDGADDAEILIDGSLDPSTAEAIEAKRRQNTLAARRSRQRKLQHVRELEEQVTQIAQDRDMWRERAYNAESKLRAHGINP